MATVDQNPLTPAGSEPLKQGPTRFREIKKNILVDTGLPGNTDGQWGARFQFESDANQTAGLASVIDDPNTDLGIVPKRYADAKVTLSLDVTDSLVPNSGYAGTTVPTFGAPPSNALLAVYVQVSAGTNDAPVTLTLNGGATLSVVRPDGSDLLPGDFAAGMLYLLTYDVTLNQYRLVQFAGGSLPLPLILAADPADDQLLGAATKQYADRSATVPSRTLQTGGVIGLTLAAQHIITVPPITIPSDSAYDVHVEYLLHGLNTDPSPGVFNYIGAFVTDGTNKWAAQAFGVPGTDGLSLGGAGFGPASYAAGATVNITIDGFGGPSTEMAKDTLVAALPLPTAYAIVTLVRARP